MFFELLAKTNYSFLEGASHPEEMIERAFKLGYAGLGITDRWGVYGAPRAMSAAEKHELPIVIGAQVIVDGALSFYILVKSREGYGDLCELMTHAHCDGEEVALSYATFAEFCREWLLFFPVRELGSEAALSVFQQAAQDFAASAHLVHSCFYDGSDKECFDRAEALHAEYGFPVVASQEPLFHRADRKPLHDVLRCIHHRTPLAQAGFHLLPNDMRHLRPLEDLQKIYACRPEWLFNTLSVAEQCRFSLREIRYRYPTEWIPEGETTDTYLERLVWENVSRRYPGTTPAATRKQLEHELTLIRDLEYSDYFLTIWDIVEYARSQNILCQGRGSAANSAVCYVLGITAIDPIRMNLLFERFLSRERREPPDIDIDFEHERREEVIQYIYRRYGRHRAAITAEVICFRRKSALREVAKVFEIDLKHVEKILTLTHRQQVVALPLERFRETVPEVPPALLQLFLDRASEILSFPRHLGTHVGGFVLCQDPLQRNVPIQKAAMPDRTIVQWDKNDLDTLDFVRVDILGLGILTCIRKCLDIIRERLGISYTLATLPAEDAKVYEAMCRGDTVGVFQIESRAQMNMLPRLRPKCFFDLVVEISLVRPGPIQGEMVHPYLRRRHGKEAVEYPHPGLRSILEKTFGVPLFQEQVMKMAMEVADFSAGEADELRRAMGAWRRNGSERLKCIGDRFRQGLIHKGVAPEYAERIYSQIEGFAEYGFPESHAASFAILAYATMYLKHYYPGAYLTAILNSQPMGFYGKHSLIHDARRHGVSTLPVDVQLSEWDNTLVNAQQMRLGFREIRGLSERVGSTIARVRGENLFTSLEDFCERMKEALVPPEIPLTRRDLFLLAGAHGFEKLGLSRREALWKIHTFHLQDVADFAAEEDPLKLPAEKRWESIALDYSAQGISLTAHPMEALRQDLRTQGILSSQEAQHRRTGTRIQIAGIVICRQMPPTAKHTLFITLEDEWGFTNLVVWKNVFEQYRSIVLEQSFLYAEGKLERSDRGGVIHVIADRFRPLLTEEIRSPSFSHDFH